MASMPPINDWVNVVAVRSEIARHLFSAEGQLGILDIFASVQEKIGVYFADATAVSFFILPISYLFAKPQLAAAIDAVTPINSSSRGPKRVISTRQMTIPSTAKMGPQERRSAGTFG